MADYCPRVAVSVGQGLMAPMQMPAHAYHDEMRRARHDARPRSTLRLMLRLDAMPTYKYYDTSSSGLGLAAKDLLVGTASLVLNYTDKMALFLQVAAFALAGVVSAQTNETETIPSQAQVIDQRSFNVLSSVLPPAEMNSTTVSPCRLCLFTELTPSSSNSCHQD